MNFLNPTRKNPKNEKGESKKIPNYLDFITIIELHWAQIPEVDLILTSKDVVKTWLHKNIKIPRRRSTI